MTPEIRGEFGTVWAAKANGESEVLVAQIDRVDKLRLEVRSMRLPPSLCITLKRLKAVSVVAIVVGTVKQTVIGGETLAVVEIS